MAGNRVAWIIALGLIGFGMALGAEGIVVMENITTQPDSYRLVPSAIEGGVVPVANNDHTKPFFGDYLDAAPTAVYGKEREGSIPTETPVVLTEAYPPSTPESDSTQDSFTERLQAADDYSQ